MCVSVFLCVYDVTPKSLCVCTCVRRGLRRARLHVDAVGRVGLQVDGLGRLLPRPGVHQHQVSYAARHSR